MSSLWRVTKLFEILRPTQRVEFINPLKEYRLIGVHLDGRGAFHKGTRSGSQIAAKSLSKVRKGDFIYSRLFAWRGAFGVIGPDLDGCYVSGEFPTFTAIADRVDVEFLRLWFRLPTTLSKVEAVCTGSTPLTRNRFKENFFLNMEIALPPLVEQRRIVARIEGLATRIQEARGLRQNTIEKVEALLASTKAEVFGRVSTVGLMRELDEVAPINMGQSPPGASYNKSGDGVPLLNGPTEFGERHPIVVQWTLAPTKLCKPGDILICVRGATTGAMNWADREYCIGRGLAALTPRPELCVPQYVYHFVETQTRMMLSLAAGSTFPNLPGRKLKTLKIPLPAITEQRKIVAHLNELEAKVDALRQLQMKTSAELDRLLPSVLDKAFNGEL